MTTPITSKPLELFAVDPDSGLPVVADKVENTLLNFTFPFDARLTQVYSELENGNRVVVLVLWNEEIRKEQTESSLQETIENAFRITGEKVDKTKFRMIQTSGTILENFK
jgi:hypothetical protein